MPIKDKDRKEIIHLAYCLLQGGYPQDRLKKRIKKSISTISPEAQKKEIEDLTDELFQFVIDGNVSVSWTLEIEEWIESESGYFTLQQCYRDLNAVTAEDKTAIRVALSRMCHRGELERCEKSVGKYRRVVKNIDVINWQDATVDVLDFRLPFDLHEKACIPRKGIIIIAGVSNQGKSGFALELVERNCDKFKVRYCASEWSASNLRRRLTKFRFDIEKAKKIEFIARSRNFADVIDPDGLNVIDFLEIHDEAWKVSGQIEAIFDKLNEGVAIILLQKKPGSQFGKGGHGTIEKAALAITLDNKILQIVKLKDPVEDNINIEGLGCNYEFGDGGRLIKSGKWGRIKKERKGGEELTVIVPETWANSKGDNFSWER